MRFARFALAAFAPFAIVAVAACSDPVPPTPQGAWTVSLVNNDPSKCMIVGHNASVGDVTSNNKNQVLIEGGPEGATIECQVSGTSSFNVTGKAELDGAGLQITIKGITTSASVTQPVMGQVGFS